MAFMGMVTTFRTVGQAGQIAIPHCIFTIENLAGSSVIVTVRRLLVQMDVTAVFSGVMPQLKTLRFSTPAPVVGTTLAKGTADSAQASSTLVQCRGANASDGGSAVTLTTPAGMYHWQQYGNKQHSAVGQIQAVDCDMLPALVADSNYQFKLLAGQGLGIHVVTSVTASNPATNHYFVNCVWQET